MIDFDKLKTRKGAKIVVVFEDENDRRLLVEEYATNAKFEALVNELLEKKYNVDGGPGTTVYAMANSDGKGHIFSEAKYQAWLHEEFRDWFHDDEAVLGSMLMALVVNALRGNGQFKGPSIAISHELLQADGAHDFASQVAKAKTCVLCVIPETMCPVRRAAFDLNQYQATFAAR